jgi:hypothetical protein
MIEPLQIATAPDRASADSASAPVPAYCERPEAARAGP